jgi:hypothetical protein
LLLAIGIRVGVRWRLHLPEAVLRVVGAALQCTTNIQGCHRYRGMINFESKLRSIWPRGYSSYHVFFLKSSVGLNNQIQTSGRSNVTLSFNSNKVNYYVYLRRK